LLSGYEEHQRLIETARGWILRVLGKGEMI